MGVGCCHCQQISVPGSIAPPKLRTAKCAWVDSTSKTQGIGVGDRSQKRNTSRCFDAWSRFAHLWNRRPLIIKNMYGSFLKAICNTRNK